MIRKEVKQKRGCGYRKAGGLYLVGSLVGAVCDRLPFKIVPCPACGREVEFTRGISKTTGLEVFHEQHHPCHCDMNDLHCPVCHPTGDIAGLMWVGKKFYSPESFSKEADEMGVSKRIPYIPKWLKIGTTWVFLAHQEAISLPNDSAAQPLHKGCLRHNGDDLFIRVPGIFRAFVPVRAEKVMTESEAEKLTAEEVEKLEEQGIDVVTVPDNDPDHK